MTKFVHGLDEREQRHGTRTRAGRRVLPGDPGAQLRADTQLGGLVVPQHLRGGLRSAAASPPAQTLLWTARYHEALALARAGDPHRAPLIAEEITLGHATTQPPVPPSLADAAYQLLAPRTAERQPPLDSGEIVDQPRAERPLDDHMGSRGRMAVGLDHELEDVRPAKSLGYLGHQ